VSAAAFPPAVPAGAAPRVLFADGQIVVVDKPAGMPSVPARTPLDPPCVAAVLREEHGVLEATHRLDRDTSGLLVLARTPAARAALGRAFEDRRVEKRYEAIVRGVPRSASGIVHLPIAPDPARPPRQRVDPILGRPAATRWWLAESAADGRSWSVLVLEPITGRSHQLRVHLSWLGMPIMGDRLYGGGEPSVGRLLLHATGLRLAHPADGRSLEFSSPRPFGPVA
jgi:tRNA pseudouridine32 synthase/23S rRNA pseudouridine746 synthase